MAEMIEENLEKFGKYVQYFESLEVLRVASVLGCNNLYDFIKLGGEQMNFLISLSKLCDEMLLIIQAPPNPNSGFMPLALAVFVQKLDLFAQIIEIDQIDEVSLMEITHIKMQLEKFKALTNTASEG